ncbi:diguanylate cyclase/phosphodiesterase (GGDEF & EAL domains) with PAS/PAC sensor(s) [hydrothermal vent metagenome]|uniref:Diguanylate cyclase/phosphodiesterase (GGDEF & EAL domains) with PAS/PAC sensor(S) n=1 Tax=hydrothermal vent metagenome TaxID=652676 RepID=A0A1W1CUH4_9ZZZZ
MKNTLETLSHSLTNMGSESYLFLLLGIFFVLAYILYAVRKKKKQAYTADAYIKVFQKAFDFCDDAMLILSETQKVIYLNKTACRLLDIKDDFVNQVLYPMPKIKRKREWETLTTCISNRELSKEGTKIDTYPKSLLRIEGKKEIEINLFIDTVNISNEKSDSYTIISMHDLSRENMQVSKAYQHSLTTLPNQLKMLQDLPALFSKVHLNNNKIALILLNFDNFTRLRSIIGYEQTNQIIVKFSKYLENIVSKLEISVYHTLGNHFLLMVSNISSLEEIENLVKEIQDQLAQFYKMDGANLHLSVSAGVSVYPDSGSTRDLLDNAYKALIKAEQRGSGKTEIYLLSNKKNKYDEVALHNDMKGALERGEFEVYYQPIVKADTHEIVSAEALVRWIHPTYGFVPPDIFIGLMEKTGFIVKLGQFVLDEVLKQQKRWELFNFKQIDVSINVSMVEIETGKYVEYVKQQLAHHHVSSERIKFEITEGMAMMDEEKTKKYFLALKKMGSAILLDDFGSGYTSFNYLKKFPADILKLDKTLVTHILENTENQRITKAMIDLGHSLGMKIVVEGVETKAMVTMLNNFGCDFIQGYYFSKPLPAFEFQELLR